MTKHIRYNLIDATIPSIPTLPVAMARTKAHGADPFIGAGYDDVDSAGSGKLEATDGHHAIVTPQSGTTLAASSTLAGPGTVIQGDESDNELGDPTSTTPSTIYADYGNDTLWGGSANDHLNGDGENDLLVGGNGSDTLDGGEEYDIVSYAPETGTLGVVANLSDVAWTYGATVYQSNTGTDTWGNLDTYISIENVTGSSQNDILNAANSSVEVRLFGGDGDDTLIGGGNDDWLNGGMGNDTLINGTVRYTGFAPVLVNLMTGRASGQGEDILSGITKVLGSEGNDTIYGGVAADTIYGGAGNDVLYAGIRTMIDATEGADTVHGAIANGSGTSLFTATANLISGNGSTTLTYEDLTAPNAAIKAELGANRVGEYYNGVLYSTDNVYEIRSLIGSAGNDTLSGGGAGETLNGGNGNDWLIGGSGADMLIGGNGDDTLNGGSDNYSETLVGGAGNDSYVLSDPNFSEYVIEDVNGGIDTVDVWFNYTLTANVENLIGHFNTAFTGNALNNTITGDDFNQTIDGGAGADTMIGGNGDDVYYVDNLGDVINELNDTAGGDDTVYISVANFDTSKLVNIEHIVLVGDGGTSTGNVAPVVGGVTAPVTVAVKDTQTAQPFGNVTITDDDTTSITVTVTMDGASKGAFENLGIGSYDAALGTYTVSGTVAAVQTALQALQFNPTDRANARVGTVETTTFTITAIDSGGASSGPNSNISVNAAVENRAPTLDAPVAIYTIADNENTSLVSPFVNVTVTETNAFDNLSMKISYDGTKGVLVPAPGYGTYNTAGFVTLFGTADYIQKALGLLRFNPTDRPNAPDGSSETTTFTITLSDTSGASIQPNSNISVNSVHHFVNHAPAAPTLSDGTISEAVSAGTVVGLLTAADPDGQLVSFKFADAKANSNGLISADGRFQIDNNVIKVLDAGLIQVSQETILNYGIVVSDGLGGTSSGTVAITITNQNEAPTSLTLSGGSITNKSATGATVGTLSGFDPDGDALTFGFVDAQAGSNGLVSADGRFQIANGVVTVRDGTLIRVSEDTTFTDAVTASDGHGGTIQTPVAIQVKNVNHAPTSPVLSSTSVQEYATTNTLIGTLSSTDSDGDKLTYTLTDDAQGRVMIVNNQIRVKDGIKIDYEQAATFNIKVAVSDGFKSTEQTLTIKVTDVRAENVVGSAGNDLIRGGSASDALNGAGGNDTLIGGGGSDDLTGGTGSDAFVFDSAPAKSNKNVIVDFSVGEGDQIHLWRGAFTGFGPGDLGTLKSTAFALGTAAKDQDDRIIYDQATGKVYYDADGANPAKGDIGAALVATLSTKPLLTSASFFII